MELVCLLLLLAALPVSSVLLTRWYFNRSDRNRAWAQDGVFLAETWIEFPKVYVFGSDKIPYENVRSVQIMTSRQTLKLTFQQGWAVTSIFSIPFRDTVVIETQLHGTTRYWMITPTRPHEFLEKIRQRLSQHGCPEPKDIRT